MNTLCKAIPLLLFVAASPVCLDEDNACEAVEQPVAGSSLLMKTSALSGEHPEESLMSLQLLQARLGASAKGAAQVSYVPGEDGTFAQNHQDTWAVKLAQRNNWNASGFFLDLGAYKGLQCSNSALLEKSLGWSGICVEPFPEGFEDRQCLLVSRALSNVNGQNVHFGGHGQGRKISSLASSGSEEGGKVASTITIERLLHCASGKQVSEDCVGIARLKIPRLINFASLDVEGGELSVLETFPWESYQVGAWVVENAIDHGRDSQKQAGVRKILLERGYLAAPVANPGVDEYFVLPQFWEASLAAKEKRVHPHGSSGC